MLALDVEVIADQQLGAVVASGSRSPYASNRPTPDRADLSIGQRVTTASFRRGGSFFRAPTSPY